MPTNEHAIMLAGFVSSTFSRHISWLQMIAFRLHLNEHDDGRWLSWAPLSPARFRNSTLAVTLFRDIVCAEARRDERYFRWRYFYFSLFHNARRKIPGTASGQLRAEISRQSPRQLDDVYVKSI